MIRTRAALAALALILAARGRRRDGRVLDLRHRPGGVPPDARAALQIADEGFVLEGEVTLAGAAADLAGDPRVVETYPGLAAPGP